MRIKNWSQFQHFKDRTPPWIKLYRWLLDDPDWNELDGKTAKILVMLWLLASEDKDKNGNLPCERKIAFRLRMTERELCKELQKLTHWLVLDDIGAISDRYQSDAPETETETETETDMFKIFWKEYPIKKSKAKAHDIWRKLKKNGKLPNIDIVLQSIANQKEEKQILSDNGLFVPEWKHPTTWLNQGCWDDEVVKVEKNEPPQVNLDEVASEQYRELQGLMKEFGKIKED
jgi:hypothetical protein